MQFSLENTKQILEENPNYRINKEGEVFSFHCNYWKSLKTFINKYTGYRTIQLRVAANTKKTLAIHRLLYQTFIGSIPESMEIDHIDRNKLNNSLDNLRLATHIQNQQNCKRKKYKGTVYFKDRDKWCSRIKVNKKNKHLGYFNSEIEAAIAYDLAAIKFFGKHARPSIIKTADMLLRDSKC